MTIIVTKLNKQNTIFSFLLCLRPSRKTSLLIDELRPLQWLGKDVGVHLLRTLVLQCDFPSDHALLHPKVEYPNSPGPSSIDKHHVRHVILVHSDGTCSVSLIDKILV